MSFVTFEFALFFPLVLILHNGLHDVKKQNLLLVIAGYVFYAFWEWKFCLLIFASTMFDYFLAKAINDTKTPAGRRSMMILSVTANLGVLFFFKYFNFGIHSMTRILDHLGMNPGLPVLSVVLPLGISFYTFQSMGYVIDVYRKVIEPERNFSVYALFVCFFPQLVAGPIETGSSMFSQFRNRRSANREDYYIGFQWILLGLFNKMVLGDTVAPMVDAVFRNSSIYSGMTSMVAVIAFTCQIFCDFAGYSLIARGTARMLGIRIMENFNAPYFSASPKEFWTRWHISLSTWLKKYLYISLGGNRRGEVRTLFNLFLTMVLGGLWHGASWHYVVWGAYHGILLVLTKVTHFSDFASKKTIWNRPVGVLMMMPLTAFGWLIFRGESMTQICQITRSVFCNFRADSYTWYMMQSVIVVFLLMMLIQGLRYFSGKDYFPRNVNAFARYSVWSFMAMMIIASRYEHVSFIYFQF